ncbi:MAG: plasmid pRiA4b ORF-3 family protein [Syntrophobacteraceae bacterium]
MQNAPPSIYQLCITLINSDPAIWRRILVSSDTTLYRLHHILQASMGWENDHPHEFAISNRLWFIPFFRWSRYGIPFPPLGPKDDRKTSLKDLKITSKSLFLYEYDFGDRWEHEIILEDILPNSSVHNHPVCLAGQGRCPPEDCGGIESYKSLVHAHADPSNPYYKHARMLFGNRFNPHSFSKSRINGRLKTVDNADSLAEFCSYPS